MALGALANVIPKLLQLAAGRPWGGYIGAGWQAYHIADAVKEWLLATYAGMAAVIALVSGRRCLRVTSRDAHAESGSPRTDPGA